MRRILKIIACFFIALTGWTTACLATEPTGSGDHPLVGRYEGSRITSYKTVAFDRVDLLNGPLAKSFSDEALPDERKLTVEGKSFRIIYEAPADRSALEVDANFARSLEAKGFQMLYACANGACISGSTSYYRFGALLDDSRRNFRYADGIAYRLALLKRPQGDVYVSILVGQSASAPIVAMRIVEVQPIDTDKIVFLDASAMKDGLVTNGHVALYGIYFDTDKANLKAESAPTLAEVAKLLKANPDLTLLVVGHTDNQGDFAYNVSLSERRAASVIDSLTGSYGVPKSRLVPFGAGMSSPVALNDDEAGRKLNRRVELVRR